MATVQFDRVSPGDLITSDLMNRLLNEVESLEARVTALETGGEGPSAPVITGRFPTGDITVSSELRLFGRNFLVPASQNTVTIDGRPVTLLFGSDDKQLILMVPPDITGLPKNAAVTVTHRGGSASTTIRLLPSAAPPPTGEVIVSDATPDLGQPLAAGQTFTFQFLLDSQTNIAVPYRLDPVFTNARSSTIDAWRAGTTLPDGTDVMVTPGAPTVVRAQVTVPTGLGVPAVDFALAASAQQAAGQRLAATSGVRSLVVGSTQEASDQRIKLWLRQLPGLDPAGNPAPTRNATIDGFAGVEARYSTSGPVRFEVNMVQAGTYRYTAEIESGGTLWDVGTPDPATSTEAAGGEQRASVPVTCRATGPASENRFMVIRAIRRKDDGSGDDYKAFIRFPIRGFST
jgi:hypothetical protein